MGITIISGASAKLFGRRQSIIRDCRLIERSCHGLQFRVQTLQTLSQTQPHQPYIQAMLQEITNIAKLANTIATSLENDNSLENLKHAMTSASDFSLHFKKASSHLQQEAAQIERAAQSLL
jgi:hypothetical protein